MLFGQDTERIFSKESIVYSSLKNPNKITDKITFSEDSTDLYSSSASKCKFHDYIYFINTQFYSYAIKLNAALKRYSNDYHKKSKFRRD